MRDVASAKVPTLRFPDFEGEWEERRLGEFFSFKNGVNADKSMYGRGRKFINVMDVISEEPILHRSIIGTVEIPDKEFAKNEIMFGDILFQRSSETREEVGQSNIYLDMTPATFGGFVIRGRPKVELDSRFFVALLKTDPVRKDMTSRSGGSTRYNIGQESLEAVVARVAPTLKEQRKVADFLTALDERVQLLRRRRDALSVTKKATVQQIFSNTLRFTKPDGSQFPAWQKNRLGDRLIEHGEFSSGVERVHSVSVHKGVVDQIEHLGRSFSALDTSNYNLAKPGDIIYTKSPTGDFPYGIIKQNLLDVGVIVSPLYGVYTPETSYLGYILNEYFESKVNAYNYLHPLVQKGAKNTINITNDRFLEGKLALPVDHEEQRRIAEFLSAFDAKLGTVVRQLNVMRRVKKGLLQQMFV